MFFILSKMLSFLISPFTWMVLLFMLSIWYRKRNNRRSTRCLFTGFALMLIFSNSFLVDEVIRRWEMPVMAEQEMKERYAVGVVLGGGMVTYDVKYHRLTFRSNLDRILQAVDLYQQGRIEKILISSGSGSLLYPDMLESSLMKKYLVKIGLPEEDIFVDSTSNNTYQNAVNTAEILDEHFQDKEFLLITSSIHMKRARACFLKQGVTSDCFPTNKYVGEDRPFRFDYLFIPDVAAINKWNMVFHELIGYGTYFIMGYL